MSPQPLTRQAAKKRLTIQHESGIAPTKTCLNAARWCCSGVARRPTNALRMLPRALGFLVCVARRLDQCRACLLIVRPRAAWRRRRRAAAKRSQCQSGTATNILVQGNVATTCGDELSAEDVANVTSAVPHRTPFGEKCAVRCSGNWRSPLAVSRNETRESDRDCAKEAFGLGRGYYG